MKKPVCRTLKVLMCTLMIAMGTVSVALASQVEGSGSNGTFRYLITGGIALAAMVAFYVFLNIKSKKNKKGKKK